MKGKIPITKTFSLQSELPQLPVPSLESTQVQLKEWIKPLVSTEQFEKTTKIIEKFFETGGEAEQLQDKLLMWAQNSQGNWLTPFWNDLYLNHRDSLPLTSNFNVLLDHDPEQMTDSFSDLAGKISVLVAKYYHDLIDEKVKPAMQKDKPLDMSQYKKLFRSIRLPKKDRDIFKIADFSKVNNHVAILYKNNIYKVPVTTAAGKIFTAQEISRAIKTTILTDEHKGTNANIFTTANREVAAETYQMLRQSKENEEILEMIADSLVILSVDEESNDAKEAIKHLMLHPANKYFDKTIQIILTTYGQIGFNIEHAAIDGTSIAPLIQFINQGLTNNQPPSKGKPAKVVIEKKVWMLTQEIKEKLTNIADDYQKRSATYFLASEVFTGFGAEQIKKMRLSPNAFFHMALQLAKYRTYGTFKSVYAPVSVDIFYEGRTECARGTSVEKSLVVQAIETGRENKEIYQLMQIASDAHASRIRNCQQGLGVERHLYGLEKMYDLYGKELEMKEKPEIFLDQGYQTLCHDFLSTSGMVYDNALYRMFAPAVQEGHGVAYLLLPDSISLNISSFKDNEVKGQAFMKNLLIALTELQTIATSSEIH